MPFHRNKLYLLLTVACVAGYIWLYYTYTTSLPRSEAFADVCIFKHLTNIPCPSCGATRSALAFIKGDILGSIYWNPIGILLLFMLVATPIWMLYDMSTQKNSLLKFYFKTEAFLRKRQVAIPAMLLVIGNWFWNIYKGL